MSLFHLALAYPSNVFTPSTTIILSNVHRHVLVRGRPGCGYGVLQIRVDGLCVCTPNRWRKLNVDMISQSVCVPLRNDDKYDGCPACSAPVCRRLFDDVVPSVVDGAGFRVNASRFPRCRSFPAMAMWLCACPLTDNTLTNLALSTRSVPVLNVHDADAANQGCGIRRTQNLFISSPTFFLLSTHTTLKLTRSDRFTV